MILMQKVFAEADEEITGGAALHELERLSEEASALLRTMANPIRLRILCLLVEGDLSVGVIASRLELREALVSQHLTRLRLEGVVQFRRAGTSMFYSVRSEPAMAVLRTLHDYFCGPAREAAAVAEGLNVTASRRPRSANS